MHLYVFILLQESLALSKQLKIPSKPFCFFQINFRLLLLYSVMGVAISVLFSAWKEILEFKTLGVFQRNNLSDESHNTTLMKSNSIGERGEDNTLNSKASVKLSRKNSIKLNNCNPLKLILETSLSFKNLVQDFTNEPDRKTFETQKKETPLAAVATATTDDEPFIFTSPRPDSELDAAAVKVQKVYKSYRTRRNLADCAVVVEELWWKALDFAALKRSSVSFFNVEKPETAVSRWARAGTRAAKVGKGLSKDEKAQKLALQHWLEAIDPRHRYGHNLHLYYDVWFTSESSQPFFYWLDIGDGKEINLEKCPRTNLQRQCIKYLAPKERESYEVIIEDGKLMYKLSRVFVDTVEGSKWIFVLSTSRDLYIGQKQKGVFQHSSFLAGGAITAAGRLVAHKGVLEAVWPYSGHYHPTEENFREFISFLEEKSVDLSDVKKCAIDDDYVSFKSEEGDSTITTSSSSSLMELEKREPCEEETNIAMDTCFNMAKHLTRTWTNGAGPRISCVREYPVELQTRALEQVNLSPRLANAPNNVYGPIPSPRPSPKTRLSPRIGYMGLPSPRSNIFAVAN